MTRSSRQELISEGPSRGPEKSKESLAAERVPGAAGERDWFRFLVLLFKDCVTVPTILTRSGRQELISEGPSRGPEKSKEGQRCTFENVHRWRHKKELFQKGSGKKSSKENKRERGDKKETKKKLHSSLAIAWYRVQSLPGR